MCTFDSSFEGLYLFCPHSQSRAQIQEFNKTKANKGRQLFSSFFEKKKPDLNTG